MDVRLKQRAVIEFLTAEGVVPIDIHRRMKLVYGEACVDVSTVRRWAKELAETSPAETDLHDKARCGRPNSASDVQHQERVDEMIQANRRIKVREVSEMLGISVGSAQFVIHDVLGYRKLCARWVPHMLSPELKLNRSRVSEELLARYTDEGEAFIRRIVTGDETWVHHYDPENKSQSKEYRHTGSPGPKKFKVVSSAKKVLMTVFWDCDGLIHMEFLEHGSTVNSDRYIETLRKLRARLTRVRPGKNVILHHDNARPHTSRQTQDAMKSLRFHETLPHPSYSPDLAPSDFYLFPKLKNYLKGKRFADDDEVQEDVRRWFRGKPHEFFADGMRQLIRRWRICIDKEGDYVEK